MKGNKQDVRRGEFKSDKNIRISLKMHKQLTQWCKLKKTNIRNGANQAIEQFLAVEAIKEKEK